jgi:hypothetical protein
VEDDSREETLTSDDKLVRAFQRCFVRSRNLLELSISHNARFRLSLLLPLLLHFLLRYQRFLRDDERIGEVEIEGLNHDERKLCDLSNRYKF